MSQENVGIVRQAYEAFAAGGVEATRAFFAPDLVLYSYPEWAGPSEYRGHDGLRAVLAEWTENFDDFKLEGRLLHWKDFGQKATALRAAGLSE